MIGRRRLEPVTAAAYATVAVLLSGGIEPARSATSFAPTVGAVAAWTDNIDLSPPGQETAGELYDLEPGFSLLHDSAREHASINYTLHALFFSPGGHDFLHSGSLTSITQVLPDWFELDIAGQRTQGTVSPAAPADLDYLFPVQNIGNFTSGLVRPVLKHTFRAFRVEASYTRGISEDNAVAGANGPDYRANESDASFTASSIDKNARLSWDANFERQQSDYESPYTLNYSYEQASGDLGLLTISSLRLLARGGAESDPENGISEGGLGSAFWAGGVDWSTGPRDDLKLLVGHRYFGRSYELHWRREMRLLKLQVDYTEQPTTLDSELMQAPLAAPPIVQLPGVPGYSRLAPDVFLEKSLSGAASISGRLTEVGVSISSSEQIYYAVATPTGVVILPRRRFVPDLRAPASSIVPYSEDRYRTAMLYATRHLGPLMDVKLSATLIKYNFVTTGASEYTNQLYSVTFTRKLGRRSSVYLRGDHMRQYGQIDDFNVNMVSLGVNMTFGKSTNGPGSTSSNGY